MLNSDMTKIDLSRIGQRITRARLRRGGMKQAELAGLLEVSQSVISDIETGKKNLDILELDQIMEALGVSATFLLPEWFEEAQGEESEFLSLYRIQSKETRKSLRDLLAGLTPERPAQDTPGSD